MSLTKKIMISLVLGIVAGLLLNRFSTPWVETYVIKGVIEVGSQIFMASLKLMVIPLVFVSLVTGTGSLQDVKKLGRIGLKTFVLYTLTTCIAIAGAIVVAEITNPGLNFNLTPSQAVDLDNKMNIADMLISIFPSNPIEAMAKGEVLQVILFAILFGIGITMSGEKGQRVLNFFNDLNEVILNMVIYLIHFAPIGVFCLLVKVFSTQGFTAILPMAKYFFTVILVLFLHAIFIYGGMLKFMARLSPIIFIKKFKEVWVFAFSTASSNATIPLNLETCEHKLGMDKSVSSFVIPFGATINMDGTAIMQGVAVVFVAQAYGIPLGLPEYLMVILTATLASIGTAGVPSVGLVMLAMVFNQVGLPVEGIGLIIGVDRLLDMLRTCTNITGDAVVGCIVAKTEGKMKEEVFYS
ncbi:MAG TPA: dicarboxylate/amino acid:cation symporter [Bacteriovoracaceae bacterium]|nr:dicarboxylate/amino acid:cation symporter [Bacteriovoracaceae bacterium]